MTNAWTWLVLIGVCAASGLAGYVRGSDATATEYRARMAEADARRADEDRARAETVAKAEKSARERLEAAQNRAAHLADQLAAHKDMLARSRAALNRRIADVSDRAARDCAGLTAEWVRVYNEALGLAASPGGGSGGAAGSAPGAAAPAVSSGAARAGVRPGAPIIPAQDVPGRAAGAQRLPRQSQVTANPAQDARVSVTPEDVLAHARDYGAYCRTLASQCRALVDWETR